MRFDAICCWAGLVVATLSVTGARADETPSIVPIGTVFIPSVTALSYVEQAIGRDELRLTVQAAITNCRIAHGPANGRCAGPVRRQA